MGFIRKVFKKAAKGIKRAVQGIGKVFKSVDPKVLAATLALNIMLPGLGSAMSGTLQSAGMSAQAAQVGGQLAADTLTSTAVDIATGDDVSGTDAFKSNLKGAVIGETAATAGKELTKAVEVSEEILDNLPDSQKNKVFGPNEISKNVEEIAVASETKQPIIKKTDQELLAESMETDIGADVTKKGTMLLPETNDSSVQEIPMAKQFTIKGQEEKFSMSDFSDFDKIEEFATKNNLQINFNKDNNGPDLNNPFVLNNRGQAKKVGFFADSNYKLEDNTINPNYGKINWDNAKEAAFETTGELAFDYGLSKFLAEDYDKPVGATGFISPEAPQEAPQAAMLENVGKAYMSAGYQGPINLQAMGGSSYFGPGTVDYMAAKQIEMPVPTIPIPN